MLSIAILWMIEAYAIDIVGQYQRGFINGKSISCHVFMLRQTMEKYYEFDKDYIYVIYYVCYLFTLNKRVIALIENNYR